MKIITIMYCPCVTSSIIKDLPINVNDPLLVHGANATISQYPRNEFNEQMVVLCITAHHYNVESVLLTATAY